VAARAATKVADGLAAAMRVAAATRAWAEAARVVAAREAAEAAQMVRMGAEELVAKAAAWVAREAAASGMAAACP